MQSEELSPEELTALLSSYMPDIPGYRVIRRIGKGGMSYVYLGVQESLDRQVAIKVMSPEALTDEKSKQRFEQEAHTIAKLEHPCIVGIHEVGRTPQGLLYYVLPYLARGHLGQRDFTADDQRIIEVLRALLSALDYAHARGIVHRDVKAENVLFDNADRPLLTDFGIALSRREDSSRITSAGLAVGSGGYMSPEQARGEAVDGRADLYSVGVLAFELLNGRLPFVSSDPLALALMHAQDPIPRLPVERKHWQSLLDRSMAKSPDNRFRNAQQMLGALNQISLKGRAAAGDETAEGADGRRSLRRWIRPVAIAAAGVALLLLAAMWLRPAPVGPQPAGSDAIASSEEADAEIAPSLPPPSSATALTQPTTTGSAISHPTPADPIAPTAAAVSATPAAFAAVLSGVTVNQLDFDPLQPGARALHAAHRQLRQNRLSTPPGDNASDSLVAAMRAGAANSTTTTLAEEILSSARNSLVEAVKAGHDDTVRNEYRRTLKFASDSGRLHGDAWKDLRLALAPALVARLEKAQVASDARALDQTKALARALAVEPSALEPAWSKAMVAAAPQPAKIMRSVGPSVVLVQAPSRNKAGLAFMRGEVTRAEYAGFASSTGRPITHCRNRLAPITIKRRTWVDPGFPQTSAHPAVCVSFEDASAYAQWLSRRTGETFRLPSSYEWRQIAAYRGSGDACQDGRIDCGQNGTAPVSQGPASPLGLTGVRGNAREWLSDCQAGCRQRLVGGLGWRDGPARAEPMRSSGFDAATGFDDVGFRLVREVPAR